jgi:hypothetical protein
MGENTPGPAPGWASRLKREPVVAHGSGWDRGQPQTCARVFTSIVRPLLPPVEPVTSNSSGESKGCTRLPLAKTGSPERVAPVDDLFNHRTICTSRTSLGATCAAANASLEDVSNRIRWGTPLEVLLPNRDEVITSFESVEIPSKRALLVS